MTREEELISELIRHKQEMQNDFGWNTTLQTALDAAIAALKDEPCDAVSRSAVLAIVKSPRSQRQMENMIEGLPSVNALPSVTPEQRLCKDCRYFESDHWEKVDGIPLIVAHEICNRWGDGCKTSEDGYCFLFEPQESEDKE